MAHCPWPEQRSWSAQTRASDTAVLSTTTAWVLAHVTKHPGNLLANATLLAGLEHLLTTKTKAQPYACKESRAIRSCGITDSLWEQLWLARFMQLHSLQMCPACLLNTDLLLKLVLP